MSYKCDVLVEREKERERERKREREREREKVKGVSRWNYLYY
jgi:hypothetical protein